MSGPSATGWHARGLLFENCSCTVVCPGHVHFDQQCTLERCVGYWAIEMREGRHGGVDLAGVRAVVAYDSPRHMIDGQWTQVLILDPSTSAVQRDALERIFDGRADGPWAVLARFVGRRLPTRLAPIRIEDDGRKKRVVVEGVLDGTIEAIRGRDRERPVTFENMFNQIHASTQMLARGTTRYDDGTIRVDTRDTHGLYSTFHWRVGAKS